MRRKTYERKLYFVKKKKCLSVTHLRAHFSFDRFDKSWQARGKSQGEKKRKRKNVGSSLPEIAGTHTRTRLSCWSETVATFTTRHTWDSAISMFRFVMPSFCELLRFLSFSV